VRRASQTIARATTKVLSEVSQVKYVGGLLSTGLLAGTQFGYVYGATTGDWRTVGRAQATGAVLAGGAWAGGALYANYGGLTFVAGSYGIGYTAGYSISSIYGASSAEARNAASRSGNASAAMALLYLGYESAFGETAPAPRRSLQFPTKQDFEAALGEGDYTFGARPLRYEPVMVQGAGGGYLDTNNLELLHEEFFYNYNGKFGHLGFTHSGVMADPGFDRAVSNISQYRFEPIQHGLTVDPATFRQLPGYGPGNYEFFSHNCQDFCDAVRQRLP
jgi:hypothetical protein